MHHMWDINDYNVDKVAYMIHWKFSNELHWTPGVPGRGILLEDELHTWNGSEGEGLTHPQYGHQHGITGLEKTFVPFYIDPDGGVRSWLGDDVRPEHRQMIQEADPRLNAESGDSDQWHFGSDEHDILDWDEGQEGKGLIDRDGHVYTWDGEEYETHHNFLEQHPEIMPMRYFWIEPDGQCRGAGLGDELDQMDEEVIREADPRLYVKHEEENTWSFKPATL